MSAKNRWQYLVHKTNKTNDFRLNFFLLFLKNGNFKIKRQIFASYYHNNGILSTIV